MATDDTSQSGPAAHGGVRGMAFDRRSSQFEGRFGRLFRSLPAAQWSDAALRELAGDGHQENRMSAEPETNAAQAPLPVLPVAPREDVDDAGKPRTSRLHDDEENSGIDAGYTYLGQFIDHDLTFDPASSLQSQNDVDALVDFRTPRFDLDSLYGCFNRALIGDKRNDENVIVSQLHSVFLQLHNRMADDHPTLGFAES